MPEAKSAPYTVSFGKVAPEQLTEQLYGVIPEIEWKVFADDIAAIQKLKRAKNAIILAHNYQTPEIFHGVADIVGDSLALARAARDTDAEIIVMAGVHFMAETAKILNPNKKVLIPDLKAGCSLAESITVADMKLLRQKYPGVPIVTYVNTSAAIKALSDICCTSANAKKIVESLGVDRVIMVPDEYLAQNIARETKVKIIAWRGHCEVHERFTAAEIADLRQSHQGIVVLAHPECPPDVVMASDFAGSTAALIDYVEQKQPARVVLLTECSMSDNVALSAAKRGQTTEFIRPCNLCPHMKRITLAGIRKCLEESQFVVTVADDLIAKSRLAIDRMLAV
ncbi:MAG: quinolinate synthase NadA [Alphaproteobacteria bacterium]|nr:quinolinate synthase NadA [Alphaproteobacteria bacterium]